MTDDIYSLAELLQIDNTYSLDAYQFVRDGLTYAVETLEMNQAAPATDTKPETPPSESIETDAEIDSDHELPDIDFEQALKQYESGLESPTLESDSSFETDIESFDEKAGLPPAPPQPVRGESTERHLTGQQLCEALRRFALHQYGFMSKIVLANWGVTCTADFGEIVYNMIEAGWMKKSEQDRKHHFDNVYDFEVAFEQEFQINQPAIFWPG